MRVSELFEEDDDDLFMYNPAYSQQSLKRQFGEIADELHQEYERASVYFVGKLKIPGAFGIVFYSIVAHEELDLGSMVDQEADSPEAQELQKRLERLKGKKATEAQVAFFDMLQRLSQSKIGKFVGYTSEHIRSLDDERMMTLEGKTARDMTGVNGNRDNIQGYVWFKPN